MIIMSRVIFVQPSLFEIVLLSSRSSLAVLMCSMRVDRLEREILFGVTVTSCGMLMVTLPLVADNTKQVWKIGRLDSLKFNLDERNYFYIISV